jgi:transcriptional regulator with XRE-family HTH domain
MQTAYIGNGIRTVRKELKMTQQQLADKLGIDRSLLSFYENGRAIPNYSMIERMAKALNCTVGDLFRPSILEMIRQAS